MVNTSTDDRSERGQLVLIGAISIAFILLGVVVVFNSVQYTETVNSGGAESDLSEVRMVESELRTGVETLNNNSMTIDDSSLEELVNGSYQNVTSHQQPLYVHYNYGSWNSSERTFNITIKTSDVSTTRTIRVENP